MAPLQKVVERSRQAPTAERRVHALPKPVIPGPSAPAEPAHAWRGLLLDSARTAWSVEVIHELLELMARYRLNRLHWHLTDDSGWRFAVPGYDRLTEIGAQLPRPDYGWYSNVLPAQRDRADARAAEREFNGHYTAEEIAGIVAHAGELGIEVMPELDLPGHMAAAIRAYPELGDPRLRDLDPAQWDHPNDLLWPSEASFAFLTAALETVAELFPFSVVHIGGDECKHQLWEADPALMARYDEAAEAGSEDGAGPEAVAEERSEASSEARAGESSGPAASPQTGGPALPPNGPGSGRSGLGPRLQGMFTDHARQVLAGRARRVAAWDELIGSPTTGEELIVAWRAQAGVEAARASGHEWIFADCTRLYLNRVAGDPATEPPGMFGPITPRDILELEVPSSSRLLGLQAAVWTEFVLDREHLLYQLFPRLLAVAERAWCGPDAGWEDFSARLETETAHLREAGILREPDAPGEAPTAR